MAEAARRPVLGGLTSDDLLAGALAGRWSADAAVTYVAALALSGGTCTIPALSRVAARRGCTLRTAQRHIRELRAAGLVDAQFFLTRPMPSSRLRLLTNAKEEALRDNAAAVAKRAARIPRPRPQVAKPRSPVPALLELFTERVTRMPDATFRPAYGVKELAQIKRFLAALPGGVDEAAMVLHKVTDPRIWAEARREFAIAAELPSPSILLGFGTSLVPWLLAHGTPRRSGGGPVTAAQPRIDPETGWRTFWWHAT